MAATVSRTECVTTYTGSDTDDSDDEPDVSLTTTTTTTAKRARTTDTAPDYSGWSPRAAKRPRTDDDDDEPPRAHSPTAVIGADASADSESSDSESDSSSDSESDSSSDSESDSESDDSDEEEASDAGDAEKSRSEGKAPVAEVDTMTHCIKRYVSIVETRMHDRRERQSWQQIVDEARRNIQYEIDYKRAWKVGIARGRSYLAVMKGLLNVSTVRTVDRKMMLEVIGQARDVLEERWGGE